MGFFLSDWPVIVPESDFCNTGVFVVPFPGPAGLVLSPDPESAIASWNIFLISSLRGLFPLLMGLLMTGLLMAPIGLLTFCAKFCLSISSLLAGEIGWFLAESSS